MNSPLRLGIAGLGTVGASLARLIETRAEALANKAGRAIRTTAVCARDRSRDRGFDSSGLAWFDDPVKLAAEADIDVFVELIGGSEGPALDSVKAA
ncbi:MAG: homoserine dehydrogenase, partial [Aurantimonas coralicida]